MVGASGDSGADDGTSHLSVNFPASDPYVLGIGGTTLRQTTNGFYTDCMGRYGQWQGRGGVVSWLSASPQLREIIFPSLWVTA